MKAYLGIWGFRKENIKTNRQSITKVRSFFLKNLGHHIFFPRFIDLYSPPGFENLTAALSSTFM